MTLSESDGGTCLRCGYNLTGLDDRRACPECGLLVGWSRKDRTHLQNNHPRWLRQLSWGAATLAGGVVFCFFSPLLLDVADRLLRRASWGEFILPSGSIGVQIYSLPETLQRLDGTQWLQLVTFLLLVAIGIVSLLLGTALITIGRPGWSGWLSRLLAIWIGLVFLLRLLTFEVVGNSMPAVTGLDPLYEHMHRLIASTGVAGGLIAILVAFRLKSLARRAPAPLLAADSPLVGVTFGVLLAGFAVLLNTRASTNLLTHSSFGDILIVAGAILGAVCLGSGIWSIYLLFRYSLAFESSRKTAVALFEAKPHGTGTGDEG